jgi:hypothetical protein
MENTPKQESLTLMLLTKIFACHQDEIPELVLQFFHLNKKHMHQLRSTLKQESLIDNEFMTSFISDISAYTVYM